MAQFAELTLASGRRVMVNPDNVANFSEETPTIQPGGMVRRTSILLAGNPHPMTVQEPRDEVLRRLCAPVAPDGCQAPDRDELAELRRRIGAFRILCEESEYTDTGAAWELLDDIEEALKPYAGA